MSVAWKPHKTTGEARSALSESRGATGWARRAASKPHTATSEARRAASKPPEASNRAHDSMTSDPNSRPGQPAGRRSDRRRVRDALAVFRTRFAQRRSRAAVSDTTHKLHRADTPADVGSVRAKSSRHGKSTAEKWNQ